MTIPPTGFQSVDDHPGDAPDSPAASADHAAERTAARRRTAQRVLDLLTAEVRDGDTLRWDRATPYLLRHAAEHAADAGSLPTLFDDLEFLVHGDPRSILTTADEAEHRTALTIYRTSLPRHVTAPAIERRHILAVDAVRHQRPDLSHRLYDPPGQDDLPWHCAWSTAANISPALRSSLSGHRQSVHHLAVGTVDGEPVAATAGPDESVRLFHAATGTLLHAWNGHTGGVTALAFHSGYEDADVITADTAGRLRRWDARTGRLRAVIDAHHGPVTGLRALSHADHLCAVSTGRDGAVHWTDLDEHRTRLLFDSSLGDLPGLLALSPPPDPPVALVAIGGHPAEPGYAVALDLPAGRVRHRLSFPTNLTALEYIDVDGRPTAVATAADGTGRIWDVTSGEVLHDLNRNGRPGDLEVLHLTSVDTPGGPHHLAITGACDGLIRVWDLNTARLLHRMDGHHAAVLGLSTVHDPYLEQRDNSPELGENVLAQNDLRLLTRAAADHHGFQQRNALAGLVVLSASADETVRGWHALDGKEIRTYTGHTGPVRRVAAFEPTADSDRLWAVSCSDDATGRVWDLADRTGHITGAAHPGRIDALATATPHSQTLTVTTSRDNRLRVLDTRTGSLLSARITGDDPVRAVALGATREGPVCATASPDKGLVVRLVETGAVLWQHQTDVPVVAVQAGGSMRRPVLLTLDENGHTHTWELATGRPRTGPLDRQEGVTAIATGRIRTTPVAVTGHPTGEILLWNLPSGTLRRTLCPVTSSAPGVRALSFAAGPTGPRVASQHTRLNHHSIRVTNADTGRVCSIVHLDADDHKASTATVFGLGSMQEAAVVAVGGPGNAVRLWNADTGDSHTALWLPDTVHGLTFDDNLLTVAYGRELAVFAPAALCDTLGEEDAGRSAEKQNRPVSRRSPSRSLLQTTLLTLLLEWEGHNVSPLASLLCRHVPTRAVKAAVRTLIRDGMIIPSSKDALGYALEPKGRALARPARPSKTGTGRTPPLKLRGWHGKPCGLCTHRKFR
ncbi:WD40 repeat domain-containing protein [Streptomyces sp. NBS 14/10]|uniref:WD40 repeat domain-containing protein n=1 Tax=Streptomyces sp. NBS 14/10 TaxID=1945643 RepID=UPI000B7E9FA4|nr:WD40 repeat domain-containing protein [Streptomyces sp. NBS 14/10]KAK1184435.1 WD40 repeat domain-containing protein [Streptomyces sp. NBS 14/10]